MTIVYLTVLLVFLTLALLALTLLVVARRNRKREFSEYAFRDAYNSEMTRREDAAYRAELRRVTARNNARLARTKG